ncbi:MAG: M20/M25/M40 family metallo-hydrolase, partial [Bacteroidota bacterium]
MKILTEFPGEIKQKLIALRRDLHQHPELSFNEEQTSLRLFNELKSFNLDSVERVAGTGVIAQIKGQNRKVPAVALRGDIDALPIQEETKLKFASTNPGVMHACGHDIHASWIVAAAYSLIQKPAAGDVVLILQPAEEVGKGAL